MKMSRHVDLLQHEVDNAHDKQEAAKRKVRPKCLVVSLFVEKETHVKATDVYCVQGSISLSMKYVVLNCQRFEIV